MEENRDEQHTNHERRWLRWTGTGALLALTLATSGAAVLLWQRTVALDAQVRDLTTTVGQTRDELAAVKAASSAPGLSRAVADLNRRVDSLEGWVGPVSGFGDSVTSRLDTLESNTADLASAASVGQSSWSDLAGRVSVTEAKLGTLQGDLSDLCTTLVFSYQVRANC